VRFHSKNSRSTPLIASTSRNVASIHPSFRRHVLAVALSAILASQIAAQTVVVDAQPAAHVVAPQAATHPAAVSASAPVQATQPTAVAPPVAVATGNAPTTKEAAAAQTGVKIEPPAATGTTSNESAAAISPPSVTTAAPITTTPETSTIPAREPMQSSAATSNVVAVEAPPTDIWDRIRAGYAMGDLDDELVGKWEKYYADRPDYVARIVERSSKYMFYIVTELERRNMPLEIALLPMIESAFNPIAHSTAKASGIWQFIPSTGTAFGMKQDWWADSRRDIVAATNGALDYLTKLHGMFGDWQLALASYNWGEGAVMRASNRAKAAGKDGTYLTLNMPAETRNYLPKLQAVKNIIRNPSAYGLTIASVPNEPYFKTITLAHALDLKKAAQLAGMSETEFVALNPSHNRPVIAGRGDFQILLPANKAEQFISRLEADENPRVSWMAYKTRQGDRVDTVAQRFGTTVAALKSVNGIRGSSNSLPAGYNLLVPSDGPSADALGSIQNAVFTKFPEQAASPRAHRVRKGETLGMIAKRYGVATTTLAKWNRLGKPVVRAGQTLYVSGPAPTRAAGKNVRASYKKGSKVSKAAKGGKQTKAVKRSTKPKANRR
jgi:membrane-bound lytic murein transglycosylase D